MDTPKIIQAIKVQSNDDGIRIVLPSPEEFSFETNDWAQQLCKLHPGKYRYMTIDLRRYKSVNSILCAGFIHLYRSFHCEQANLINVHPNVESILKTLQLDKIFQLEINTKRTSK